MIPASYFWTIAFTLAAGTLVIRGSLIALSGKIKISARVREMFSFIPAAILPAFIAPAVFFHQGKVGWLFEKERLVVLILASIVCYLARNTLITIIFGLTALYIVTSVS